MSALAYKVSPAEVDRTLADVLSQFALPLGYDDIPATVRERAKHLILDSVGIALASTKYPFASVSLAAFEELGTGTSAVIGVGRRLSLRDAVLMNGILVHGLDFDDTHSRRRHSCDREQLPLCPGAGRPGRADGETLLAAYVAAMEVATRLGAVAKGGFHQVGFHPTGLIGAFGCALAAAKLLGLDPQRATMAQGIVLSMASGSLEFLEDGAWTKRMHPGWAGVAGITAATLAKHGFVGPRGAYDGRFGLYASHLGSHFAQADLHARDRSSRPQLADRRGRGEAHTGLPLRARRRRCRRQRCTTNTGCPRRTSAACGCWCRRKWSRRSASRSRTSAIPPTATTRSSPSPTSWRPAC